MSASDRMVPAYSRLHLLAIGVLGFALRVGAVYLHPTIPTSDAADYDGLARRLAIGSGYVTEGGEATAWRPPGYPFFLAAVYSAVGPRPQAAAVAQAALGALTVALIGLIGIRLFGRTPGMLAALLAALYPAFVWLPRALLSENLALPLTVGSVYVFIRYLDQGSSRLLCAWGAVLALCLLTRPATVVMAFMLGGLLAVQQWQNPKRAIGLLLLSGSCCIVILSPWWVRNYRTFRAFVPFATQDGITLYSSYWPPANNGRMIWGNLAIGDDPVVARAPLALGEVEVSRYFRRATVTELGRDPMRVLALAPEKVFWLLVPFDWEWFPHPRGSQRSLNWAFPLAALLALLGVMRLRSLGRYRALALLAPGVATVTMAVVFYGSPRFRLIAEPFVLVLAGAGLGRCAGWLERVEHGFWPRLSRSPLALPRDASVLRR